MNKVTKTLIVMSVIAVVLFSINFFINKKDKKNYENENYITIKGENIPSIYSVIGEKKVIGIKDGTDKTGHYIELVYDSALKLTEVSEYLAYLGKQNYALISATENDCVVAIESKDIGKILTVIVKYADEKTIIKYSKGSGTITRS
ncbi:MAG: hypothetical protein RRY16_02630 [Bacilli bacterium]